MGRLLRSVRPRELMLFLLGMAGMFYEFLIAEKVQVELVLASLAMMGVALPARLDDFLRNRSSPDAPEPETAVPRERPRSLNELSTLEIQHVLEQEQERRERNGGHP